MSWGVLFWDVLYLHSFGTQTVVSKYHFLVKGSLPGATSESKAEVWNVHGESGNLLRKQGDGPRLLEEFKGFRSQPAEVPTHQKQDNLSWRNVTEMDEYTLVILVSMGLQWYKKKNNNTLIGYFWGIPGFKYWQIKRKNWALSSLS